MGDQTLILIPVWVDQLTTEAAILPGDSGHWRLTARASPAPLHCHTLGPLFDAGDVEDLEAVPAVPGGLLLLHLVKADHALGSSPHEGLR